MEGINFVDWWAIRVVSNSPQVVEWKGLPIGGPFSIPDFLFSMTVCQKPGPKNPFRCLFLLHYLYELRYLVCLLCDGACWLCDIVVIFRYHVFFCGEMPYDRRKGVRMWNLGLHLITD